MKKERYIALVVLFAILVLCPVKSMAQNSPPIADAGLSRYAAQDPIVLDGTGSYDPDNSGLLSYTWWQISGPSLVITDANSATPTISGFTQTDEIQECEFELEVSDGDLTSLPDTVKVIIVPDFGARGLRQENPPFDRNKPTLIYFGGGDCLTGSGFWGSPAWAEKANVISGSYRPDGGGGPRTYYKYGDVIIVYLSSVAPDYKQPIQAIGFSTGGQPAIDVGIHLNLTYQDPRYAVNRVTFLDAACRGNTGYSADVADVIEYLGSAVDGEQCWIDSYESGQFFYPSVLNAQVAPGQHGVPPQWYKDSLTNPQKNQFNGGLVAGAYWSVIGPGKNLQLASTPDTQTYKFQWYGDSSSGYMDYYDEPNHPGRLPEPVTLVGPVDVGDPNGAVLTCEESENAISYQLLFGSDPYRVMDYNIISDTPAPPNEIITILPFEVTWWTVRVYDEYGSTIYADPKPISIVNFSFLIENISTGKRYGYIQDAINDAAPGDEIVIGPGTYHENISFEDKNLEVRSTNPNDPVVVAATVINGVAQHPVVTLSRGEGADCVLDGFTISGGTVGVSCHAESLTIRNCTIGSNGPIAIEFWEGYEPRIIDCTVLGYVIDRSLLTHWTLDETEGDIAADSAGEHDGTLYGDPVWEPAAGQIDGALSFDGMDDYVSTPFVLNPADGAFSVFAWIKGGASGEVVISQQITEAAYQPSSVNWLLCTPPGRTSTDGKLMTELQAPGGVPLESQVVINDGDWHEIGFVWDGLHRTLYVDDIAVAEDTQAGLEGEDYGLYIGAGKSLDATSFWSGLIDDVRIYNRAVTP